MKVCCYDYVTSIRRVLSRSVMNYYCICRRLVLLITKSVHVRPSTITDICFRMLEFRCNLPEDYLLNISLYNYDPISLDELIGSTTIDLEDRIYTKHRARVGITSEYSL